MKFYDLHYGDELVNAHEVLKFWQNGQHKLGYDDYINGDVETDILQKSAYDALCTLLIGLDEIVKCISFM